MKLRFEKSAMGSWTAYVNGEKFESRNAGIHLDKEPLLYEILKTQGYEIEINHEYYLSGQRKESSHKV